MYPETRERTDLLGVFATVDAAYRAGATHIRAFWLLPRHAQDFTAYTPVAGQSWAFNQDQILEHALAAAALVVQEKYDVLYAWWLTCFEQGDAPFYLPISSRPLELGFMPAPTLEELSGSQRMAQAHELSNMWTIDGTMKCRVRSHLTGKYKMFTEDKP